MTRGLRPVRWRAALALLAVCAGAVTGCASLDEQQRRWIFQPSKESWGGSWDDRGMHDEWVDFTSRITGQPARLHALWLPADAPGAPVLLYLHGARWDVRGSAPRIRRMQALGFSVLAIDYRGFGRSGEELPSEDTAHEDARAAWEWLAARHPGVPRYIFGHSLGGAVAVRLAAEVGEQPAGLMLENTFTSIRDVVAGFRWGWLPVGPLITQPFDARARVPQVRAPLLVVHGSADRLIPHALGRALYDGATTARKKWVLVEGGSHHSTNAAAQDAYREALRELFGLGG